MEGGKRIIKHVYNKAHVHLHNEELRLFESKTIYMYVCICRSKAAHRIISKHK